MGLNDILLASIAIGIVVGGMFLCIILMDCVDKLCRERYACFLGLVAAALAFYYVFE